MQYIQIKNKKFQLVKINTNKELETLYPVIKHKTDYDFDEMDFEYLNLPCAEYDHYTSENLVYLMIRDISTSDLKKRYRFQASYDNCIGEWINLYKDYIIEHLLQKFIVKTKNEYNKEDELEDDEFDDYYWNTTCSTEYSIENNHKGTDLEVLDWFLNHGLIFEYDDLNKYHMPLTKQYIEDNQTYQKPIFK